MKQFNKNLKFLAAKCEIEPQIQSPAFDILVIKNNNGTGPSKRAFVSLRKNPQEQPIKILMRCSCNRTGNKTENFHNVEEVTLKEKPVFVVE